MIFTDTIIRETMKKEGGTMTNEEAIGCLDLIKTDATRINEAIDMAIEALEKNIPKKPMILNYDGDFVELWNCPNCNHQHEIIINGKECFSSFCDICGQRIDWSE